MRSNQVKIELHHLEFRTLKANGMISGMCSSYLATAKRQGDYMVIDISIQEANDFAGWVAAEANHAETDEESDLLNSACDAIELQI
jgi:hypothetical protein